ncbi:MAG: hypothetical protein ACKVZ0_18240 [Gemmatimonadales bacterium]
MRTPLDRTPTVLRSSTRRPAVILAAFLALGTMACNLDEIIQVEPPDRVTETVLSDPAQAGILVASVQGSFECTYGGYALAQGLLGGELGSLGNTPMFSYERRDPQAAGGFVGAYASSDCAVSAAGNATPGVYTPLSSSRWFADETVTRLEGWTDQEVANRTSLIATAAFYAGYSYTLLGESMCTMAFDGGPEVQPAAAFAIAEERFTKAIAAATTANNADILNAARVGRARVRLDMGKNADAVADATLVPANFVKNALRATGNATTNNQLWQSINNTGQSGLTPPYYDVRWLGTADPRVKTQDLGNTTLGLRRVIQLIFPAEASPLPLATWEEAQLIIAEVQGGQAAVTIIDALHTKYGLAPSGVNPTDAAAVRAQVVEERRRQLFLTGSRAGDIRRLNLPLVPAPGSPYGFGGVYGSARCYPVPDAERNANDNF